MSKIIKPENKTNVLEDQVKTSTSTSIFLDSDDDMMEGTRKRETRILESDDDEEEDSPIKTPQKNLKRKKKEEEESDEEDFSRPDFLPKKENKLKGNELEKFLFKKVKEVREREEHKDFIVPEGVQPESMKKRYFHMVKQTGLHGLKCRGKGKYEECTWYNVGTTKQIIPVFWSPETPSQEYNNPTPILKAYAISKGLAPKSIKGFENSEILISLNAKPPKWTKCGEVWHSDYRKKKKAQTPVKSKKTVKKNKESDEDEQEMGKPIKKSKLTKVHQYSKELDLFFVPPDIMNDTADSLLRYQIVKAATFLSDTEIKKTVNHINELLAQRYEEKKIEKEVQIEQQEGSVVDQVETAVSETKQEDQIIESDLI